MCRTGTLGDYLGLPTFGTNFSNTITLTDKPCASNARNFTTSSIDVVINAIRADSAIPGSTCATHFNYNGSGTVIFKTSTSSTPLPENASQVGFNVALVGGSADAFIGSRGYVVHVLDDGSYNADYPVTIVKSKDNVVGAIISSVDVGDLTNIQGGLYLVLTGMQKGAPLEFTGMSFNALLEFYKLQDDVTYSKYPFATEGHQDRPHLLLS